MAAEIRFLQDENFHQDIVNGLKLRLPELDIVRVQDVDEVAGADDPTVLSYAAGENRIILTHDITTLRPFAYERVAAGLAMPGVIVVKKPFKFEVVISRLVEVVEADDADYMENKVIVI